MDIFILFHRVLDQKKFTDSYFRGLYDVLLKKGQLVVEAEGEEHQLDAFVEWCRKGPESAIVSSLVASEKPVFGYDDFKIL